MKFLKFLPLAAIACLTWSCESGGGNLSESSTPTDSLMYYLGEIHAADYMREANRDTVMKETSEKQAYLAGLKAGLAVLKEGNDNYNKGVQMGLQMASQIMSFSKQMDVQINKNEYIGSISKALMADSMPDMRTAQSEFQKVMTNIEKAKQEKDQTTSRESLKQVAQAQNLPEITDDLYGKVLSSNDSVALKDGDEVSLVLELSKENGDRISMPLAPKGKIGNNRNFPEIISKAMTHLKSGETGEFLTSAHALAGQRVTQLGLEPTDVVKMKITATLVPQKEEEKDK